MPNRTPPFPNPDSTARTRPFDSQQSSTSEMANSTTHDARSERLGDPDLVGSSVPLADGELHVEPIDGLWRIRVVGSESVLAVVPTQKAAHAYAREVAAESGVRVVVHRTDGSVPKSGRRRA